MKNENNPSKESVRVLTDTEDALASPTLEQASPIALHFQDHCQIIKDILNHSN